MTEKEVVVVRKAHSSEDDLVHVGSQGHVGHYLVVRLVRVCEERNLLARYDGVVEVDPGDSGRNQFRRLAPLVRIDGRTADLTYFAFHLGTSVDRIAVGVEETS